MKNVVYDLDSGKQSNIRYQRDDTKFVLIFFCVLGLAFFLLAGITSVKDCNKGTEEQGYKVVHNEKIAYDTICPKCRERIIKIDNPNCIPYFNATVVVDKYGLEYDAACGLELILDFEKEQEDRRKLEEVLNNGNVE